MAYEMALRFLAGGTIVSLFAVLGDMLRPKSFAGLFGAAPSVALATLALTICSKGDGYASLEARSMMAGAAGFFVYAFFVTWILYRWRNPILPTTIGLLVIWFLTSTGFWILIGVPS